ncbi:hypothetical protein K492DRAFT_240617 [Lichtheimia hyalospora FSU 10163]|nr:hypothetical protein K492DRAFT_240617 [Lichtheimia hyalospora FSU 10163]
MPAQSWEDLISNLDAAQHSGSHELVIGHSTSTCDDLIARLIKLLEIRVRSLVATGEFNKALEDAIKIQLWKPESVDGYLLSGSLYERYGYYRKAIAAYNKGLATVPKSNPQYQQLVKAKLASTVQQNKTVDFIRQLPWEPVTNILRMVMNEPLDSVNAPILHVCKRWNQKIVQLGRLHFRITGESCIEDGTDLINYAPNVQSLDYVYNLQSYKRLLKRASFPSLKRLYFQDSSSNLKAILPKLIRALGNELEHLEIESILPKRGDHALDFGTIVWECPKLLSLKYYGTSNIDIACSSQRSHPSLRSLTIQSEVVNSSRAITDMFERLPYLEDITLVSFISSRTLMGTLQWCRYLRYLALGPGTILPKTYVDPERDGLQVLDLSINEETNVLEFYSTIDIASILHAHARTLVACRLNLQDLRSQPEALQLDARVHFSDLKRLDAVPMESPHHIAITEWIITRAPNLQVAHLGHMAINENIIQTLSQLGRLEKLNMFVDPDQVPLLRTLIAALQDIGMQSPLTTFELCIPSPWEGLVDDLLSIIQLPRIKTLKLDMPDVSESTLTRFVNAFKMLPPHFEYFKLVSNDHTWLFPEPLA